MRLYAAASRLLHLWPDHILVTSLKKKQNSWTGLDWSRVVQTGGWSILITTLHLLKCIVFQESCTVAQPEHLRMICMLSSFSHNEWPEGKQQIELQVKNIEREKINIVGINSVIILSINDLV